MGWNRHVYIVDIVYIVRIVIHSLHLCPNGTCAKMGPWRQNPRSRESGGAGSPQESNCRQASKQPRKVAFFMKGFNFRLST